MRQMMWPIIILSLITDETSLCNLISKIIFLTIGLLFIGLSIPLIKGKIKPNSNYGFRTPKTFSSEEIWYKANKYMGRDIIILGSIMVFYNLVLFILPGNTLLLLLLLPGNLIVLITGTAIAVVRSFKYLRKL